MNKRIISVIATLTITVMLTADVKAEGSSERVDAYVNKAITVEMDGETLVLQNSDGSTIYPVIYNDRTYLPMRAIAQALGINVDWDLDTKTVSLSETEKDESEEEPQSTETSMPVSKTKINTESAKYSYAIKIPSEIKNVTATTLGKPTLDMEIKKGNISKHTLSASRIEYIDETGSPVLMASLTVYLDENWEGIKDTEGAVEKLGSLDRRVYVVKVEDNPYTKISKEYKSFEQAMTKLVEKRFYVAIGDLS